MDEYEYFFAIKSCNVDMWDICVEPFIISKSHFLIGQYIKTEYYNKKIIDVSDISYECIVFKLNKNTSHINTIITQLNYADIHYSKIPEVYLYGVISSRTISNIKNKIQKTIRDAEVTMVSLPIYVSLIPSNPGEEIIITMQGQSNSGYMSYNLTLPLFKTPL